MPAGVHVKTQLNVRVSDEAHAIISAMQQELGISQSAVLEMLLRAAARDKGWKLRELIERYG
jgi:antitoxin component of RelBE/YafQ-DinJ toxin-antitoxin module